MILKLYVYLYALAVHVGITNELTNIVQAPENEMEIASTPPPPPKKRCWYRLSAGIIGSVM